ncbi:MAG: hypothetical protein JWM53_3503 [bacterium]|nr:hypothetical protein [bacterium]
MTKKKESRAGWSPRARQKDLIVKRVDGELLVYDVERHRAHSLSPMLAALWRRCDGRTTPRAIGKALRQELGAVDDELVWLGLERLSEAHLLREDLPADAAPAPSTKPGAPSRRQWLRQAAALGMAAVSITVPTLAEAASTINNGDCARRSPPNCGNTPCGQNPGNVCKLVIRGRAQFCSCTLN